MRVFSSGGGGGGGYSVYPTIGTEPPLANTFTLVQANGLTNAATLVKRSDGALVFAWSGDGDAGSAEPVRLAYRTAPAAGATGYRVTSHLRFILPTQIGGVFSMIGGLGFRNSTSGSVELMEFCIKSTGLATVQRRRYTASNNGAAPAFTFSAQTIGTSDMAAYADIWLRVERTTAGARAFDISTDGLTWKRWTGGSSVGNDFITPDQVFIESCVFADGAGNLDAGGVVFDSYVEEAF